MSPEDNEQNLLTYAGSQDAPPPVRVGEGGVHLPPADADREESALDFNSGQSVAVPPPEVQNSRKPTIRLSRLLNRANYAIALLIVLIGVIAWLISSQQKQQGADQQVASIADSYAPVAVPLAELIAGKDLSVANSSSSVTVNGQIQLNGSLSLAPALQPTGARAGEIYYDSSTNQLAYFNGEQFVFLTAQTPQGGGVQSLGGATGIIGLGTGFAMANGQLTNNGVLSVQGQTGDVAFAAGPGLILNGTTFSNDGVISIAAATPNVVVTDDGEGNITIGVVGAGTGTVASSGGATGAIPVFTTSQNIESSIITQSGLAVSIGGSLALATALPVTSGGTGATSLAANGVLVGQGTSAVSSLVAGGSGLCLISTAGAPTWANCSGGGSVTSLNGLTGALTIANASGSGSTVTIDDASYASKGIASFNSTNFTVTSGAVNTVQNINTAATPTFAGVNTNTITPGAALTVGGTGQTALLQGSVTTITSTGAGNDIILNAADTIELQDNTTISAGLLTIGTAAQAGSIVMYDGSANTGGVQVAALGQNTIYTLPDPGQATATICLSTGNCSGAAVSLQGAYNNSTNPEIVVDATRGALTVRDAASAIGANLLEVQSNAGSTTYFGVAASGITVTGTATVTGTINTTTGDLQTAGTTRIDTNGNLTNIGNITGTGAIAVMAGGANILALNAGSTIELQDATNITGALDVSAGLSAGTADAFQVAANGTITTTGSATLQGGVLIGTASSAGVLTLHDGSTNTASFQTAALGQNTIYTLPDPGTASVGICLTTGNCAGSGGGLTTSGGSTNRLAKFSGSQTVADSTITDNGTTVTTSVDIVIQGGDATIGTTAQAGSLLLHDGSGQTTTLQAGNSSSDLTFILPTTTGNANQCLKQSGAGNQLIFQDCDGGSGGSSATLQSAYNNGNSITTTDARDFDLVLSNTTTDANFDIQVSDGSTSYVSVTRQNGVSATMPAQLLLLSNLDTDAVAPTGLKIQSAAGGLTYGIDITGANIGAALAVGANTISGTTGNIDYTNFDVTGATGAVTAGTYNGQTVSSTASFTGTLTVASNLTLTSGDIAVNGGDITSSGALNITPGGALTAGTTGQTTTLRGSTTTITSNGAGNDIFLTSADTVEIQGTTNVTGNVDISGSLFAGTANAFQVATTGTITSAGNALLQGGTATLGTTAQSGALVLYDGSSNTGTLQTASLGQDVAYLLPDPGQATATICLSTGNCSGAAVSLQGAYNNSTNPEIVVDATRGALTVRNASTPIGANLFEVQNNAGSTTYLAVTATATTVTGGLTHSGGAFSSTSNGSASLTANGSITITAGGGSTWSTSSGNLTVQANGTSTLRLNTSGSGTVELGNQSTATIDIGRGSDSARTIRIGDAGSSSAQTVTLGSLGTGSTTTIQGGTAGLALLSAASVTIGTSDATGTMLVLDTKSSAGDPTGAAGGMYYNSSTGKFRCYQAGAWTDCISAAGSTATLQTVYTASVGSTTPEVKLDSTRGGLDIQDADTTIGGALLTVRASNASGLGAALLNVGNTGATTMQNSTDSSNAFQILNQAGSEVFGADTTNSILRLLGNNTGRLGTYTASSTLVNQTQGGAGVSVNGYLYLIGGCNDAGVVSGTVQYAQAQANGSVGTWSTTTAVSGISGTSCDLSATTYNGYIYVSAAGNTNLYYARPNSNGTITSWQTANVTLDDGSNSSTRLAAYNGYIYQLATNDPKVSYAKLNADGSVGTLTSLTNWFNGASRRSAGIAIANGYLYIIGGNDTSVYYGKLNADGSLGTLQTGTTLPHNRQYVNSVISNGYIYVFGGEDPLDANADGFQEMDTVLYAPLGANGSIGAWTQDTTLMPAKRSAYAAYTVNGYVYIMGGWETAGAAQDTVWYTTGSRVTVGGGLDLIGSSGENSTEGGSGGTLTAGNTRIVGTMDVSGNVTLRDGLSVVNNVTIYGGLQVFNGTVPLFSLDLTNSRAYVGNPAADTTGALLVLDTKSTTGDPAGVEGAMYYNAAMGRMRCYYDSQWRFCNDPVGLQWGYHFSDDFIAPNAGIDFGTNRWNYSETGSGIAEMMATIAGSRPGLVNLYTGTTAASSAGIYVAADGGEEPIMVQGGMEINFAVNVPVLSTAAQEFVVRAGLCDVLDADCVDGVYIEYDRLTSANWSLVTANNSTRTRSQSTTAACGVGGSPVAASTGWNRFRMVVNSAATQIDFYINGAFVGCSATNIPTARTTSPLFNIYKVAGTQNREFYIDYIDIANTFSTAR